LFFFSAVNILARAFYALQDIKTPMKISLFCLGINLVFALILVQRFREIGLGTANTISAVFNASLLLFALRKKLSKLEMADLNKHMAMLLGSAVGSGLVAWQVYRWFDGHFGHATFRMKLAAVFVPMAIGCGICFGLALALRVPYVHDIFAMLPARFRPKKTAK
jgi:putative peptidoglycan lipid II flippase